MKEPKEEGEMGRGWRLQGALGKEEGKSNVGEVKEEGGGGEDRRGGTAEEEKKPRGRTEKGRTDDWDGSRQWVGWWRW